jgi:hypothetical protein
MIYRSEYGPRCPHCGHVNPASVVKMPAPATVDCFHCRKPFGFWLEYLPFFCTDTKPPVTSEDDAA